MFRKKIAKRDRNAFDELNNPEVLIDDETGAIPLMKVHKKPYNFLVSTKDNQDQIKKAAQERREEMLYQARPELVGNKMDGTAENLINTDYSHDSRTKALKNLEISRDIKEGKIDTKYYRGLNGYVNYMEKTETQISNSKYTGSLGPIRAPTNIRATCRFDYNPSLCKDYAVSGYCTFGALIFLDSCIYIHDRGDYKSGWELERDWEEQEKKRLERAMQGLPSSSDEDQEDLIQEFPKICLICEQKFKNVVVTQCGHFFCENCILQHYGKSQTCFSCNKSLNGIFNDAQKIIQKLKEEAEAKLAVKNRNKKIQKTDKKNSDINAVKYHKGQLSSDEDAPQITNKDDIFKDIVFDNNNQEEEEDLAKLSKEFTRKIAKQKNFKTAESDWLFE